MTERRPTITLPTPEKLKSDSGDIGKTQKSGIFSRNESQLLVSRSKAEIRKFGSENIGKSTMAQKSEILSKARSQLFESRSKAHLQKSDSRDIEKSCLQKKSEILTRTTSRMLRNKSKVFQKRASWQHFRKFSFRKLSDLPNIPTSGTKLLEWTRNNMSFMSTSELSVISSGAVDTTNEELEIVSLLSTDKKASKKKEKAIADKQKDGHKTKKQKRLKKSRVSLHSEVDEAIHNTNLTIGLEDEIMTLFRKRKEEESLLEKAGHTKSEVTFTETVEDQSKKEPKQKKRRKAKQQKQLRMNQMMMEEIKAAEELAKQLEMEQLLEKLAQKRVQEEEEENVARERNFLLKKKIQSIDENYMKETKEEGRKEEWIHYSTCEKVPEVTKMNELTFFVHKLELEFDNMNIQEVTDRIATILLLLDNLEKLKYQVLPNEQEKIDKLDWVIGILRDVQWTTLEKIVYRILLDIKDNMVSDNLEYATFHNTSDYYILSLWVKLDWPISFPNPKKPAPPKRTVTLSNLNVDVTLPASLSDQKIAIMGYYLPYDHKSDSCSTYSTPPMSDFVKKDLLETNQCDRLLKNKYEYECFQRTQYINKVVEYQNAHGTEKYPFPFVLLEESLDGNIPIVPVQNLSPTADEYLILAEEMHYERSFRNYITYVDFDEMNLREYHIVGGTFAINLLYHPPQRQEMVFFHMDIRNVFETRKLDYVPFLADSPSHQHRMSVVVSPAAKVSGKGRRHSRRGSRRAGKLKSDVSADVDEPQLQKEMESWEAELEAKKENMIFVSIRLPDVVYLEQPIVCMWNETVKVWETSNIYDTTHDDKDRTVTFLTTQLGIFGLAVKRYLNFPYRHWDIRPKSLNSIDVTLVGSKIGIHLTITDWNIQITRLEYIGGSTIAWEWLLWKDMTLPKLVKTLRLSGLDFFPDYDANCYYKDTSEKHWAMSYTTYYSMAMMAAVYNFSSSKWNSRRDRRSIILKVREFNFSDNMNLLLPYHLVHVTPSRCQTLHCTEDDDVFTASQPESTKFQPNLFQLLKSMIGPTNRDRLKHFSLITIYTLAQFLVQTRLFSFS